MRKHLFSIVIASFALVLCFILPINAINKAPARPCEHCGKGTITTTTTRSYTHDERFPCTHGTHSWDVYAVYEVKTIEQCNFCGYSATVESYEEHVYKNCTN